MPIFCLAIKIVVIVDRITGLKFADSLWCTVKDRCDSLGTLAADGTPCSSGSGLFKWCIGGQCVGMDVRETRLQRR